MILLSLEFFKIRRKKIGMMILFFLFIEMMLAFITTSISIANHPDQAVWESIIFNIAAMNGLFMPILSAVVVSRICDMEHKGGTWKMLVATNVSRTRLYAAKYICANSLLLFCIFVQTVIMLVIGLVKHFTGEPPIAYFIWFIGGALLTTLAITALQQWVSLAIKNQAFALVLGMLGAFIGMTAGLFPAAARHIFIWSYYLDLSPVTFKYTGSSGAYTAQPVDIGLVIAVFVMTVVIYIAGNINVNQQEI
ncbi:ABC transporter permease [Heyndrickxia coagulans]|uniref:ABC transporter permease n=1 Tax=Heyndrickxia coagulans TaxID=1398 RepID=A0A133KB66_HEYCO|nr:ABC transporter permease [Heyndrickxia coagulans]KWZ76816.1 hypothetical protein HMPREF3213_03650 [Heyndrickxia coagulans]